MGHKGIAHCSGRDTWSTHQQGNPNIGLIGHALIVQHPKLPLCWVGHNVDLEHKDMAAGGGELCFIPEQSSGHDTTAATALNQ